MLAILGGLGAALAWTVTTLVASRASRLIDAWSLLATVMTVGLLVSAPVAAIAGVPSGLNRHSFGWLAVSGAANVAGLLLTYGALSVGKVGVVAPVTSTEGAVAAVIAVIAGEQLSGGTVATLIAVAAGVALAAHTPAVDGRVPRSEVRAVVLAAGAALSFGLGLYPTGRARSPRRRRWLRGRSCSGRSGRATRSVALPTRQASSCRPSASIGSSRLEQRPSSWKQASATAISAARSPGTVWRSRTMRRCRTSRSAARSPPRRTGPAPATSRLPPRSPLSSSSAVTARSSASPARTRTSAERLPHFRLGFTPSGGDELQSEYAIASEHAAEAVRALRPLGPILTPLLLTSEIRAVAADSLWLSPFHERDSVCIHFTWKPLGAKVHAALRRIEVALAPFEPRPHWGKMFIRSPAPLYPRLREFRALRARLDPGRVFGNAFDAQLGT